MHLLLSVALSFTHTRRLMTTIAPTKENPTLWTLRNWVTFTQYHEGIWTKRNIQFGNGKKGKPAHFRTAWAQEDAFLKRYNSDDWKKAVEVKPTDQFKSFTDSNGIEYLPRLMHDGFTVNGEEVYKCSTEGKSVFDQLGRPKQLEKPA